MIVFKLSWLPYMLILTGIILAADGQPAALILTAIGCAWLYFKYQGNQSGASVDGASDTASTGAPPTAGAPYSPVAAPTAETPAAAPTVAPAAEKPVAAPAAEPPVVPVTPAAQADEIKFCCNCGTKAIPGSVFCSECGEKLR